MCRGCVPSGLEILQLLCSTQKPLEALREGVINSHLCVLEIFCMAKSGLELGSLLEDYTGVWGSRN